MDHLARAAGVNACWDIPEAKRRFSAASFRNALRRLRPRRWGSAAAPDEPAPPEPSVRIDASALTHATRLRIRPPWWWKAWIIASPLPPAASGARRQVRMPPANAPSAGIASSSQTTTETLRMMVPALRTKADVRSTTLRRMILALGAR